MLGIPEKIKEAKRFKQVAEVLIKHELGFIFTAANPKNPKETEPQVVREIVEELGGSFVKLGQILSLRPDLIPNEYCDELSKLQDKVKPFPYIEAKKIVEKETGKKLNSLFKNFSVAPEASASIGQVHSAKLKTGEKVAIKIQRPEIKEILETDIEIMFFIAKLIDRLPGKKIFNALEIAETFKEYTEKEINYKNELESIKRFHANFLNTETKIPLPYQELSTEKVLVMEFLEGEKISDLVRKKMNYDEKKETARKIFNVFLKQIFVDGYFHADPHPGNILRTENGIALLDFGITGELDAETKANLLSLFLALYSKDIDKATESMIKLHIIKDAEPEMKNEIRNLLVPYYNVPANKINVPKLFIQSLKIAKKNKMSVPKDLVLLGKTVLTLESVCTKIYPEFNFVDEARPFITKMLLHEYSPKKSIAKNILYFKKVKKVLEELPDLVENYLENNDSQNRNMEEISKHMKDLDTKIDKISERMFMTILTTLLLLSGFLLIDRTPRVEGISVFSLIAFLLAITIIFLQIKKTLK